MNLLIEKMRADFAMVASVRRASGDWTSSDEAMAGGAIRMAIDLDDRPLLLCWARWLAELSARDVLESPVVPVVPPAPRACVSCRHLAKPGRSSGHCGGRTDLPPAYGEGHPLRVLPDDGGVSCPNWLGLV